jgi:hypothetical protein
MDDPTLAVVMWGLAALVLGWTWVPAVISGLGGTRYANGGTEDPTALEGANELDYLFWQRQIAGLGYEPVGPAWMRVAFHGSQWRYETAVRVFYSRAKQAYVFVQRQPRPLDVWWLTMFATCWQDGGILLTSNAVDEPPGEGESVVQGMESHNLAMVEELHRDRDATLRSEGRRPYADGRIDTLLAATERHARESARRVGVSLGQTYMATHMFVHFFMTLPAAILVGMGHWGVPLGNLVLGGLFNLAEHLAKRRAAAIMREQIGRADAGARPPHA